MFTYKTLFSKIDKLHRCSEICFVICNWKKKCFSINFQVGEPIYFEMLSENDKIVKSTLVFYNASHLLLLLYFLSYFRLDIMTALNNCFNFQNKEETMLQSLISSPEIQINLFKQD